MAPRVDRIMLFGFCWEVQKELPFNQQWACAFHTSHYTDENHPSWDSIDDPSKRREIRYGTNIYILFRAMLHCSKWYPQSSFWTAMARGFNTSVATVKTTAEILTAARRARRGKGREVSDTARAADEWIDFLDSLGTYPRMLSDPEVYKVANAFFDSQEKKHFNAAYIPLSGSSRFPIRAPVDEPTPSPRHPPSPHLKMESSRDSAEKYRTPPSARKRSASPPTDRSAKQRRVDHDARPKPRTEPERHGALDELPTIQPTRSPRRQSFSRPAPPAPQPGAPREQATASFALPTKPGPPTKTGPPASAPTGPAKQETAHKPPAQPAKPAQPSPQSNAPPRRESAPSSSHTAVNDASASKPLIESLEKQLAEAKRNHSTAPGTNVPNQLTETITGLQDSMASATNAISTIMESMHHVVDGLHSNQDEVAGVSTQLKDLTASVSQLAGDTTGLSTQVKDLTATLSQFTSDTNLKLDGIISSLQTITSAVTILHKDVTELKNQPPPPAAPSQQDTDTKTINHVETLIQEQNTRMEKFFREVQANMQAQARSNTPQQQVQPQQQQLQPQPPQTLRQAYAAAERDLKRHMDTIEAFYHRGGASRSVTERTAAFLAALEEGVRAAQAELWL